MRDSSCRSFHGENGDSPFETAPRLNEQRAEYLRSRPESFRSPIREAPRTIHNRDHLSPKLTGEVAAGLAKFYSAQTPPAAGGDANRAGAAIYRNGAKDIPNRRTCHSEWREGRGVILRLVGQHRDYALAT